MANPTTNFGWVMPTSSSLVTNLPADFNTFGQAVDTSMAELKGGTTGQILSKTSATDMDFTWITNDVGDITAVTAGTGISGGGTSGAVTVTNSMATAITTAGDLIKGTGSGTFDRLGIGSTGQVLTVAAGAPSWATPAAAASGMTFISRSTFSNVATKEFAGVFTSSYYNYLFVIESLYAATSGDDLFLRFMYSTNTQQVGGYYGTSIYASYLNTTVANDPSNGANQLRLSRDSSSTAAPGCGYFYVNLVGNASEMATLNGQYFSSENGQGSISQGGASTARTYTGFVLFSGSTNITGAVSIYGLAKA
jgi:hypothetical protein